MAKIEGITLSPGFITISGPSGPPTKYPIAAVLRQADIPTGLTHSQVAGISLLANLVVILIRTLIDKEVLGESFLEDGGYDLDDLIYVVEKLGGDYGDPHFNSVESA